MCFILQVHHSAQLAQLLAKTKWRISQTAQQLQLSGGIIYYIQAQLCRSSAAAPPSVPKCHHAGKYFTGASRNTKRIFTDALVNQEKDKKALKCLCFLNITYNKISLSTNWIKVQEQAIRIDLKQAGKADLTRWGNL